MAANPTLFFGCHHMSLSEWHWNRSPEVKTRPSSTSATAMAIGVKEISPSISEGKGQLGNGGDRRR